MINVHLRDRFFQRYGMELTPERIREILRLCRQTKGKPNSRPGAEEVEFNYEGHRIRLVWVRSSHFILTFLPEPGVRIAWQVGKTGRSK